MIICSVVVGNIGHIPIMRSDNLLAVVLYCSHGYDSDGVVTPGLVELALLRPRLLHRVPGQHVVWVIMESKIVKVVTTVCASGDVEEPSQGSPPEACPRGGEVPDLSPGLAVRVGDDLGGG